MPAIYALIAKILSNPLVDKVLVPAVAAALKGYIDRGIITLEGRTLKTAAKNAKTSEELSAVSSKLQSFISRT
jgi:hypothetical protein